jgi:hypothetical protein
MRPTRSSRCPWRFSEKNAKTMTMIGARVPHQNQADRMTGSTTNDLINRTVRSGLFQTKVTATEYSDFASQFYRPSNRRRTAPRPARARPKYRDVPAKEFSGILQLIKCIVDKLKSIHKSTVENWLATEGAVPLGTSSLLKPTMHMQNGD